MRSPEEIKKALKICACRGFDGCKDCPYKGLNACSLVLMLDALAYIEQLESAPKSAPAPAKIDLPKGWIKLTYADGSAAFVNAAKLTSLGESDSFPHITDVRFGKDVNLIKESPEEIMQKIREAVDDGELEQT